MIRGFLSGVFWGTAVSALGLGAISQLTPLPVARIAADASFVKRAKPEPVEPVAPQVEAPEPTAPVVEAEPAPAPEPAPVVKPAPAPEPAPVVKPAPAPEATQVAKPVPAAPVPVADGAEPPAGSEFAKPLPDTAPVAPTPDVAPAPDASAAAPLIAPVADAATQTEAPSVAPKTGLEAPRPLAVPGDTIDAAVPPVSDDETALALLVPDQVALPQADAAPLPAQNPAPPAKPAPDDVLLKPLPDVLPVPEAAPEPSAQLEPDAALVPNTLEPSTPAPDTGDGAASSPKPPETLVPTPGLDGKVAGVTIGRLPRIGDPPAAAEADVPSVSDINPDGTAALVIDEGTDLPPLQKYARAFENPEAKPLFSVILIDTGGADIDRAALAALPFPVTFALDPLAKTAAEASAVYRGAGQEVIMVATGIPPGATASDLEVTFQAHAAALPEAVAVIDTEFGAFQADRLLATQVVPILKAQGRGLISWDRGLNAADQVAQREGLAAGMVFRKLDGKSENKSAVRRALDRAAFKAAQDGRVIVIGQTLPETVGALMEWALEGRAASVALAPVSAVLTTQ